MDLPCKSQYTESSTQYGTPPHSVILLTSYRPAGPSHVYVTGTFDNWAKSLPLIKNPDGSFQITAPLSIDKDQKILYKYVVDDEWCIDTTGKTVPDETGILNNFVEKDDLIVLNVKNAIPEAAGLTTTTPSKSHASSTSETTTSTEKPVVKDAPKDTEEVETTKSKDTPTSTSAPLNNTIKSASTTPSTPEITSADTTLTEDDKTLVSAVGPKDKILSDSEDEHVSFFFLSRS